MDDCINNVDAWLGLSNKTTWLGLGKYLFILDVEFCRVVTCTPDDHCSKLITGLEMDAHFLFLVFLFVFFLQFEAGVFFRLF